MTKKPLITPLPKAEWDASIQPIADRLANPLNIHKMIANNPRLMEAYTPLRYYIVTDSSLSARERELLILRTAHNCQSAYEWAHHVERGQAAGLSLDEIEHVKAGAAHAGWIEAEAVLLQAADDMIRATELSAETQSTLAKYYDEKQLLDIIYTIGVYIMLGTILKSFAVPLESDSEA